MIKAEATAVRLSWAVFCASCLVCGAKDVGPAAAPAPDKSAYSLFNPTPAAVLREMATDRPDQTESPYTVDAGHLQVEMDLFAHTRDHDTADGANRVTRGYAFAASNLKIGLLNRVDLQLMLDTFVRVETDDRASGQRERRSGFGDVTTRLKLNLWGNDGGQTALALMPYVKAPTGGRRLSNGTVEGGLIVPLGVELPGGWSMGLMSELDVMLDADGAGHHPEFIHTVTFGHDIVGGLAGYVEFFSLISSDREAPWIGMVDCGLTWSLTANVRVDAGVNLGVTRSADDVNPFVGLSFRY
jgi:hypothetical protein